MILNRILILLKQKQKNQKKTEMVVSEGYSAGEQGHKLTDVAGQVIMPAIEADTSSVVPENARKFIGRYSVTDRKSVV